MYPEHNMLSLTDSLTAKDFPSFVRECHKICRGGQTLDPDPYLLQVFALAEDIAVGRVPKAAISMPPGTAKTFIFAVCLPAWILAHNPSATVMVVEHSKKLARDTTRNIRRILASGQFRRNFKTRIDENWKGAGDFGTTQGGSVYATSVSGGITGYRADVIIVDDPLSIKNANNMAEIEFVNETFDDEILSRMRNEDSRVVVIMHRLNENDLIGHVMRKGGYKKLELPLIADKDRTYRCRYGEWNRRKGEQLRSGRFSKSELRELAFKPSFRYLYQQGKSGGALLRIKSRYFPYYDGRRDTSLPVVFSIDTAQKAGASSSRMVIQVWQTDGRDHYLLDVFAAVCDYERLWGELKRLVKQYPPSMILIEETSSGSALISQATAWLNHDVRGIVPSGSKSQRFLPHFKTIRAKRVHVPISADWVTDWVEEIRAFPEGEYDDHVDAFSMFLNFVATKPRLIVLEPVTLKMAMVDSRGVSHEFHRQQGLSAPGLAALVTRPSVFQGNMSSWGNGRPSLDSTPPVRIETSLGPVIIRRR
jgi:predicted phage terminase large subunit-like protein